MVFGHVCVQDAIVFVHRFGHCFVRFDWLFTCHTAFVGRPGVRLVGELRWYEKDIVSLKGLIWWQLGLFAAGTVVAVLLGFAAGLSGWWTADKQSTGVVFGVLSAISWGLGSIGGPAAFSNPANAFAAWCAAISLGYLSPAASLCTTDGLFGLLCHLPIL
jgi:hypothetical protein